MDAAGENKRSYRHIVYALISIVCPFIAIALVSIYQSYAYEWYWQIGEPGKRLDDADINAGAIMGFVIIVELIIAVGIGSFIGLVFAGLSLKRKPRFLSIGTTALVFNLFPFFGVLWVILRGMNSGW